MPLSENEQRILDELEKQLRSDDPSLASAFSESSTQSMNAKRVVAGGIGVVFGLGLLVFAVWLPAIWLGVLAFILMVVSATYALSSSPRMTMDGTDPRREHPAFGQHKHSAGKRGKSSSSRFMRAFEERWNRRDGERR